MSHKNIFNRVISLLLTTIFLSSFPAGAADLSLCLDESNNHVVNQKQLHLADCHSSVEANLLLSDEQSSALTEKESNNCVDVSLANANAVNRPPEITLPVFTEVIPSYALPNSQIGFQQQVTGHSSSSLSQHPFTLPHINANRTVVLLI
ncbi:MAG: hypothetical protein ABFR35_10655 [Thermodesulfobacteriota bacterium]